MKFDIVITTYNRPERVEHFVKEILTCSPLPETIFVVDSSDKPHTAIQHLDKVKLIPSSHKNQPYQRYLGASLSRSDIICFFDDDLEITDKNLFVYLLEPYHQPGISGSSVGIEYHSSISGQTPQSIMEPSGTMGKFLLQLSGVKFPPDGRISYAGMTGTKPVKKQHVDFFYGPCMSFRREFFMSTLNEELLTSFENKQGMGEDKVISMLMSQYGSLFYNPLNCLYHPAVESSYYTNTTEFVTKVLYSRSLLNRTFANVHSKNSIVAALQLWWYIIGRLLISTLTYLVKAEPVRKQKLSGLWKGMKMILSPEQSHPFNWHEELLKDTPSK